MMILISIFENVGSIGFAQSTATFLNTFAGGPRMPKTGGMGQVDLCEFLQN